jgi:hypothetical protein
VLLPKAVRASITRQKPVWFPAKALVHARRRCERVPQKKASRPRLSAWKPFCELKGRIFHRVLQVCTTRSRPERIKATSGLIHEISLKKGPPMKKFTVVLAALLTAAALGACAGKAPGKGKGKAPAAVAAPIAVRG